MNKERYLFYELDLKDFGQRNVNSVVINLLISKMPMKIDKDFDVYFILEKLNLISLNYKFDVQQNYFSGEIEGIGTNVSEIKDKNNENLLIFLETFNPEVDTILSRSPLIFRCNCPYKHFIFEIKSIKDLYKALNINLRSKNCSQIFTQKNLLLFIKENKILLS
jgi:hypothetical protein